jgi:hypothetical protein
MDSKKQHFLIAIPGTPYITLDSFNIIKSIGVRLERNDKKWGQRTIYFKNGPGLAY